MSGKTKRKIFKLGGSHVLTLPPEWIKQTKTKEVLVLFDSYMLVVPKAHENTVDKIIEEGIKQAVQKTESQERRSP